MNDDRTEPFNAFSQAISRPSRSSTTPRRRTKPRLPAPCRWSRRKVCWPSTTAGRAPPRDTPPEGDRPALPGDLAGDRPQPPVPAGRLAGRRRLWPRRGRAGPVRPRLGRVALRIGRAILGPGSSGLREIPLVLVPGRTALLAGSSSSERGALGPRRGPARPGTRTARPGSRRSGPRRGPDGFGATFTPRSRRLGPRARRSTRRPPGSVPPTPRPRRKPFDRMPPQEASA